MRGALVVGAAAIAIGVWVGCSSSDGGTPATTPDASTTDDLDAGVDAPDFGAPSDTYPAFRPSVPQGKNAGGVIVHDVVVVPIVWAGDTDGAVVPDLLAKYAASSARKAQLDEYGVTSMTIASTVTISDPAPTSLTNDEIRAWLRDRLDGSHPEMGGNDPATIAKTVYVLVYPAGTNITQAGGGKSCSNFQGYHDSAPLAAGADAGADGGTLAADARPIYAVLPRCTLQGQTAQATLTASVVHELIEAATDPFHAPNDAYSEIDPDHLAWQASLSGGELADLCDVDTFLFASPELGYTISRSWSNASAAAYHDPCVPLPGGPYFNTAAVVPDSVTFGNLSNTKGISVKKGETKTIEVDFFSDGPTSGPWTVTAKEWATSTKYPMVLDVSLDKTTGVNGEKAHLTVTAKDVHPLGRSLVMLLSKLGNRTSLWFVWVETPS